MASHFFIIKLSEDSRDEANVWIDGQRCYKLPRGAHVEISASPYPIVTIGKGDGIDDWSRALKSKPLFLLPAHLAHVFLYVACVVAASVF